MGKKNLLVITSIFVFMSWFGCSESAEEKIVPEKASAVEVAPEETKEVMDMAEVMPEFPGGMKALLGFLGENIKYPAESIAKNEQGRVVCKFVVTKEGTITNVEVVRSVSAALDNEAIRVIKSMPKWKPGMDKGTPVAVKFTLPVQFKMQ